MLVKRFTFNACSLDDSESKCIHRIVNNIKVKDATNETKDEETLVTDNSVINAQIYFKLFKWGKNFFKKLDATCERVCMATPKENYDMELLKYQRECIADEKKRILWN